MIQSISEILEEPGLKQLYKHGVMWPTTNSKPFNTVLAIKKL